MRLYGGTGNLTPGALISPPFPSSYKQFTFAAKGSLRLLQRENGICSKRK